MVRTSAAAAAVVKPDGETPPPGFAKFSATSESELAEFSDDESSDEAGPSWSRASGTTSTAAAAVTKSVGEAWPPGIGKYRAAAECRRASAARRERNPLGAGGPS